MPGGGFGGWGPRPVVVVHGYYGYPYWWYPYYGYPVYYTHADESYLKLGKQWGKDLKRHKVTTAQLVLFLRADLLHASDRTRGDFQVGFLKGYGKNGLPVLTQALSEARQNPTAQPADKGPPAAPE